ncbi:fructose-1,6-bisphosphatase II [Halobacillus dabanensis]|uniref:Fructose-1,6-bisphosphatase n=1 Tax=Halobacillus dabanensis TaxID=240302 RepID=A0A1I3S3A6_HALDA|nr:class II fructose-bisphosphatase [Halobacillus dabanensis]SFJ52016.1 fructose-1,6-bisphosphatase II [Halobacillus dabanensis]
MHKLSLDFLKVTEAAAVASLPWVGTGEKNSADDAATTAMREMLNQVNMNGTVVIGEGELDEAPMLYIGEKLGNGSEPKIDIAVDPIEGTTPTVNGQGNANAVIAAAPKGTLLHAPDMYMEKIAVGPKAIGKIDIDAPLIDNIKAVASANGKSLSELNVYVQDRDRHKGYIDTIREAGGKVHLFSEGDVTYSIATCLEIGNVDMVIGIGGAPEGVVSAVGIKCLGGEMQARLLPRNEEEADRCRKMGLANPETALRHNDLVSSDDCIFAATGITENILLNGIKVSPEGNYLVNSVLLNGEDKQLRFIESLYLKNRIA